ncbi:hypothetical protein ALT1000_360051 [Alteromonas macleodii]
MWSLLYFNNFFLNQSVETKQLLSLVVDSLHSSNHLMQYDLRLEWIQNFSKLHAPLSINVR